MYTLDDMAIHWFNESILADYSSIRDDDLFEEWCIDKLAYEIGQIIGYEKQEVDDGQEEFFDKMIDLPSEWTTYPQDVMKDWFDFDDGQRYYKNKIRRTAYLLTQAKDSKTARQLEEKLASYKKTFKREFGGNYA